MLRGMCCCGVPVRRTGVSGCFRFYHATLYHKRPGTDRGIYAAVAPFIQCLGVVRNVKLMTPEIKFLSGNHAQTLGRIAIRKQPLRRILRREGEEKTIKKTCSVARLESKR